MRVVALMVRGKNGKGIKHIIGTENDETAIVKAERLLSLFPKEKLSEVRLAEVDVDIKEVQKHAQ